ncbi:hypothetical protein BN133_4229 [Cronobacter dublinensis 582]|nr:hypothetical protein BN133_4229 [Cronobacter dublinensis 582]
MQTTFGWFFIFCRILLTTFLMIFTTGFTHVYSYAPLYPMRAL